MANPKLNGSTQRLLAQARVKEMQQKQQTLIALKLENVMNSLFEGFAGSPGVALSALLSMAAKVGLANGADKPTVAGAFAKIWDLAEQHAADQKAEKEGKPLAPSRLDVSRIPGTLPGAEDIRTTCLAVMLKRFGVNGKMTKIPVAELELADTEGLNVVFNQVEDGIELSLEKTEKPATPLEAYEEAERTKSETAKPDEYRPVPTPADPTGEPDRDPS